VQKIYNNRNQLWSKLKEARLVIEGLRETIINRDEELKELDRKRRNNNKSNTQLQEQLN